jgi:hypothetical protein
MLAAQLWTYWMGFFLFFGAVLAVLALVVGYLVKVERLRWPRGEPPVEQPSAPASGAR